MTGAMSYHGGLAAEAQVEAQYLAAGKSVAARRWRGKAGEIDLIFRSGAALIFVEVKQADTHDIAAQRLSAAQKTRIWAAASEFLAGEPGGQDTDVQFDEALVDRLGRIEIIENAIEL